MSKPKSTPEKPRRMSQAEACRLTNIQPAVMTRTWKPRFEEQGWPGFYDDGVDFAEIHAGIVAWEKQKAKQAIADAKGSDDPDEVNKWQKADKLAIELEQLRGQIVFVPDFADEIVAMGIAYTQAQQRVPRTMAPNLQTWIATKLADDIQAHPEVGAAIGKITQGELQDWLEERLDESVADMGKALDMAWRRSIERARLKAS